MALTTLAQPQFFLKGAEQVGTEALAQLAKHAKDPDVFALMWIVLRASVKPREEDLKRWKTVSESLPEGLIIPNRLRTDVAEFIEGTVPPQLDRHGRTQNSAQHWRHSTCRTVTSVTPTSRSASKTPPTGGMSLKRRVHRWAQPHVLHGRWDR